MRSFPWRAGRAVTVSIAVGLLMAAGVNPVEARRARPEPAPHGKIAFTSVRSGNAEVWVMNADGSSPTNLTNNPAVDTDPAWSPDGTRIAFTRRLSVLSSDADVWVMNADGSGQTNLTRGAGGREPAWSPDGTRIAFASFRTFDSEVWVMNADGSSPTNLTNNPAFDNQPAWSPDGTKIAFTSLRSGNREVWVMNADGSDPTNLTNNPAGDEDPAWSPDGTRIAFTSSRSPAGVLVMNADGSDLNFLLTNNGPGAEPTWSPDGTQIAFTRSPSGDAEVWVMNADGFGGAANLTNTLGNDLQPDWQSVMVAGVNPFPSPVEEGRILTVTVSVGGRVVSDPPVFDCRGPATCAGAEPPGSEISFTAIADPGFRFVGWAELSAQISSGSCTGPDLCAFYIDDAIDIVATFERRFTTTPPPATGDKIAFITTRMTTPHSAPDVWVMDADGSNPSRRASGGPLFAATSGPEWSPDGSRIAFTRGGSEGGHLWVMNADGTNPVNLTGTASGTDPAWSPDGTRIAFTSHRTGADQIWVMNADGTNPTMLTTSPSSSARSPAWSPDGTRIAFSSNRAGASIEYQIWVMNTDGSNPTNLTGSLGGTDPAWSPDGSWIAFTSTRTGREEVWVMAADGASPMNLSGGTGGSQPAWSPDGTRIAFTSDRTVDPEIWVMHADGSNPIQLTDSLGFDGHPAWQPVADPQPAPSPVPPGHTEPDRKRRHAHRPVQPHRAEAPLPEFTFPKLTGHADWAWNALAQRPLRHSLSPPPCRVLCMLDLGGPGSWRWL